MLKTNVRTVLFFLLGATLAGCSSLPMPQGSSKGYSTVRFINPKKAVGLDGTDRSIEANQIIQEAITEEFEDNGLTFRDEADLIVAYLIILQDNFKTVSINQHFGYQDTADVVDKAHKIGTKGNYPEYVQKGAIVIDVIDSKTNKLVYRNVAVRPTQAGATEAVRREVIDNAIEEALKPFFK